MPIKKPFVKKKQSGTALAAGLVKKTIPGDYPGAGAGKEVIVTSKEWRAYKKWLELDRLPPLPGPAAFDGPPASGSSTATPDAGPVPTLTQEALEQVSTFLVWVWSRFAGSAWQLNALDDKNEKRNFGESLAEFVPKLPGPVVELLAHGVMFLRPIIVISEYVQRRLDLVEQMNNAQAARQLPTPPRTIVPPQVVHAPPTAGTAPPPQHIPAPPPPIHAPPAGHAAAPNPDNKESLGGISESKAARKYAQAMARAEGSGVTYTPFG